MKVNEIAEKLNVSRQFLQQVRSGNRSMPTSKMTELDKLVTSLLPSSGKYPFSTEKAIDHNTKVMESTSYCYDQSVEIAQLRADIEELKIDMKVLKKLILK